MEPAYRISAVQAALFITYTVEWFPDELLGVIMTTESDDHGVKPEGQVQSKFLMITYLTPHMKTYGT